MKSSVPACIIRLIKKAGLTLIFVFLIFKIQDSVDSIPEPVNTIPKSGKYPGLYLPYIVSPLDKEDLKDGSILVEYKQIYSMESTIIFKQLESYIKYIDKPFREPALAYRGEVHAWKDYGPKLSAVGEYFAYLKATQTDCRKLKRMGGGLRCKEGHGDANGMDGHKYVCLDPALRLLSGTRDPGKCLTLSFGTQAETTFDEAISDLPCEVHMYDVIDFNPPLLTEVKHVHFHVEGLAAMPRTNIFFNINMTAYMDTLRNHVAKSHLQTRLIHVLKVDIENDEWEAFKDISQDPIFDAVGQVALEVHAVEFVRGLNQTYIKQLPEEKWLSATQFRYDVLKAIEARGFRRVVYWENAHPSYPFYDTDGTYHATSGEILFINTNWFNASFMAQLAARGYEFHDIT